MAAEGVMTERGTTGAGRPQTAPVPWVRRFRELDGRGTTGDEIRHGQTRVGYNRICPLKPPAMIHGSVVANGTKSFPHWTKSWLGWRPACCDVREGETEDPFHVGRWRPQKGPDEPQAAVESMSTSHTEMPCLRRFLKLVLGKVCIRDSTLAKRWRPSRQMRCPIMTAYQEAMAVPTVVQTAQSRETSVRWRPRGRARRARAETSMFPMETNGPSERRSPLPGQSEEGQLGGRFQKVSWTSSARLVVYRGPAIR